MTLLASNSCVYAVRAREASTGFALAGLRSQVPIIILGAITNQQDIVQPVHTLKQTRFLYTFGEMITDGNLQGVALLGLPGVSGLAAFANSIRVSRSKSTVSLSTPMGGYQVAVTGLSLAVPDPEYQIQPFGIPFKLLS